MYREKSERVVSNTFNLVTTCFIGSQYTQLHVPNITDGWMTKSVQLSFVPTKKPDIQRIGRGVCMSSLTKCFFIDDSDSPPMVCFHNLLQGFGDFIMFRQHVECVLACGATPECGGQVGYLGLFCRYCNQVFVIPYDALDVFLLYLILN